MTAPTACVLPSARHRGVDAWAAGLPAETADDRRLREHIERALLTTGHRALSAVSVSVCDLRVTLRGRVPRYYLRQLALSTVLAAPGVRGLRDGVAVTRPARAGPEPPPLVERKGVDRMSPSPHPSTTAATSSPRTTWPPAGRPGVLVVDDDEPVRTLLRAGLERHGFRVWAAADGAEAVTACRENGAAIAVVLLDVRLPGMDGPRTLDALRSMNGDVAACFMSGDTGRYDADDLLRRGARHVLAKPFRLEALAATLRSVV